MISLDNGKSTFRGRIITETSGHLSWIEFIETNFIEFIETDFLEVCNLNLQISLENGNHFVSTSLI